MQQLRVHNLPRLVAEEDLIGCTAIVVDLLRASTTICHALAAGAAEVIPCLEVEEALAAAAAADRSAIVLGGERGGRRIVGFDLGNSPAEYTPAAVAGRRVLLTTTNGTRALVYARLAQRVVVGAMVNFSAVAESVAKDSRVDVLCAGTDGETTREDILTAGAVVDRLCGSDDSMWQLNDAAKGARSAWQQVAAAAHVSGRAMSEHLAIELRATQGGHNLLAIGLDSDLVDCARLNTLTVVPELDTRSWRIVLP